VNGCGEARRACEAEGRSPMRVTLSLKLMTMLELKGTFGRRRLRAFVLLTLGRGGRHRRKGARRRGGVLARNSGVPAVEVSRVAVGFRRSRLLFSEGPRSVLVRDRRGRAGAPRKANSCRFP